MVDSRLRLPAVGYVFISSVASLSIIWIHAWAVKTYDELQAAHIPSWLISYSADGHVPYLQHRDDILTTTTNFLYWDLNLKNAAP